MISNILTLISRASLKPNLNTNRTKVRQQLFKLTKQHVQHFCSIWATSDTESVNDYMPGGVGLLAKNTLVSRIKGKGRDKLGRFCYILLQGQDKREILIVVIYQCCTWPTNLTGNSAFSQQEILLSQMDRPTTNPRANFYQDLCKLIQDCQTKNPQCVPIVIGDWNETCQGTSTLAKLCRKFGLVDIWSWRGPVLGGSPNNKLVLRVRCHMCW